MWLSRHPFHSPPPFFFSSEGIGDSFPTGLSAHMCDGLSVWTFLRDMWEGHKAEEVPGDALGLTLISEATRV